MVSCNLIGRQANQQFQIACCIASALRNGLEYHIPAHTLNDRVWKPMFTHLENPNWNPNLKSVKVLERSHAYEEIPSFISDIRAYDGDKTLSDVNIIIDGYRQSLKYFEDFLPEVRKAFGFDYTAKRTDVVALHKRLGDYKLHPTKHCIITDEYIKQALGIMKDKGYSKCLVFSDEIYECEQTINSDIYPDWSFRYSHSRDELQDFQLMLECGSFIISASTYSLMAAILSESKDKVCVSPSKWNWFGKDNANLSTETIIPESFIQIKY